MSRSGYSDDCDDWLAHGRWRGRVTSAIRGKRGQAFLKEMLAAMDAMPEKRLIANELQIDGYSEQYEPGPIVGADELVAEDGTVAAMGEVCALGSVGRARGVDMSAIDPHDPPQVADALGIAKPMAQEITYINDECGPHKETPEARFARVRRWIVSKLKEPT